MSDAPYQPVPDEAIDELITNLRPVVAGAPEDATLEQVLALPEAKQVIATWGATRGNRARAAAQGGELAGRRAVAARTG